MEMKLKCQAQKKEKWYKNFPVLKQNSLAHIGAHTYTSKNAYTYVNICE